MGISGKNALVTATGKAENKVEVAIIGGGLAGLNAALHLHRQGVGFQVFEAADRLGGRIASEFDQQSGRYLGDLGPTWVWPAYQRDVRRALADLDLTTFSQFEDGNAVLDLYPDRPPEHQPFPGQHGIARIQGGPQAIIDALVSKLPLDQLCTSWPVREIIKNKQGFEICCRDTAIPNTVANFIVIAAPLRLVAQTIELNGLLDEEVISAMHNTPTWMATQAKVLIGYGSPFWRESGLSGRVVSQVGPMVEIHDHCGEDGDPASLFGFIGWSAEQRKNNNLRSAIEAQLLRCFGKQSAAHTHITIRDWAKDQNICSSRDLAETPTHPEVISDLLRQGFCNNKMYFATAETATVSPGLIDGAFEAGERAAAQILSAITD